MIGTTKLFSFAGNATIARRANIKKMGIKYLNDGSEQFNIFFLSPYIFNFFPFRSRPFSHRFYFFPHRIDINAAIVSQMNFFHAAVFPGRNVFKKKNVVLLSLSKELYLVVPEHYPDSSSFIA